MFNVNCTNIGDARIVFKKDLGVDGHMKKYQTGKNFLKNLSIHDSLLKFTLLATSSVNET